ncbi:MAG TPA: hypothetical protein GXX34_03885 [Clostridia bacterium]|nr:hypothetical protein [Clostridia bacterium]
MNNNQTRQHVHVHNGLTTCDAGHCHLHPGVSSPPIFRGNTHFHRIHGMTSYDHGHFHFYDGLSGPAVSLPNGEHTHFVSLTTSFSEGHDHRITGYTQATPPGTEPHYI